MSDTIPPIDPKRAALLVMDYQKGILDNFADSDKLLPQMAKTIEVVRDAGAKIGYVRVAFSDADYEALPETNERFKAIAASRGMHADAPETAVHEAVAPKPDDIAVRKTRVGAFTTTDLDKQLRGQNIDTLILAGVSTSGVVLSTVREAADRDYRIYVLEDLCADRDPEVHKVLTQKVFPNQARVISSAELPMLLGVK